MLRARQSNTNFNETKNLFASWFGVPPAPLRHRAAIRRYRRAPLGSTCGSKALRHLARMDSAFRPTAPVLVVAEPLFPDQIIRPYKEQMRPRGQDRQSFR